jgi:hypothetical protein
MDKLGGWRMLAGALEFMLPLAWKSLLAGLVKAFEYLPRSRRFASTPNGRYRLSRFWLCGPAALLGVCQLVGFEAVTVSMIGF